MTVLYFIFVGVLTLLAFTVVALASIGLAFGMLYGGCYVRELYLDARSKRRPR